MATQLNTYPIESYLEKARIARKSGQKTVVLSIADATALEESLAVVMTRLASALDGTLQSNSAQSSETITVQMDGGSL